MIVPKVVVLGDACVDMIVRLPDRSPASTPDLTRSAPQLHGGGSGANAAVALTRLGVSTAMVGTIGDDVYGRWVRDDLIREGIDVTGLSTVLNAFTPMVLALVEPNGERLVVVWPPEGGAHVQMEASAVEKKLVTSVSWLHTTGMCLRASPARDVVLQAMQLAHEADVTVSLDLNLRIESRGLDEATRGTFERAIALSDVVFGNAEEEIVPMAGAGSVEAAVDILSRGERIVVARQGAKGALVTTPHETFHAPAFPIQVVDTLGAGDAFNGGFIAACLCKKNVRKAATWGNAVASMKIGRAGARGLPSLAELKELLDRPI